MDSSNEVHPETRFYLHRDKAEFYSYIITSVGVIAALLVNIFQIMWSDSEERVRVSQRMCENFLSSEALTRASEVFLKYGPYIMQSEGLTPDSLKALEGREPYRDAFQETQINFIILANYLESAAGLVHSKVASSTMFDNCLGEFSIFYIKIMEKHGKSKAPGICDRHSIICPPSTFPALKKYVDQRIARGDQSQLLRFMENLSSGAP